MSAETAGAAAAVALAVVVLGARVSAGLVPSRPSSTRPPRRGRLRLRRRAGGPAPDAVADWCELVARSLRSGSSLLAAVTDAAGSDSPMAAVVAPVVGQVARGDSLVSAIDRAGIDPASAPGLAVAVIRACARFGGPAAVPLERAAATLRAPRRHRRRAAGAERAGADVGARAHPRADRPARRLGRHRSQGARHGHLAGRYGCGRSRRTLNATGALWMRRIIGRPR